jgi:hypothetical protein
MAKGKAQETIVRRTLGLTVGITVFRLDAKTWTFVAENI